MPIDVRLSFVLRLDSEAAGAALDAGDGDVSLGVARLWTGTHEPPKGMQFVDRSASLNRVGSEPGETR